MVNDRGAVIEIGGQEFELVLTTRATKEIAKRYGGLSDLGDKLMQAENFEKAIDEVTYLICLLANQGVEIHNFQHPEDKKEHLTAEFVELMTSPYDLAKYKDAIMQTMYKGTKREIESEDSGSKNTQVG